MMCCRNTAHYAWSLLSASVTVVHIIYTTVVRVRPCTFYCIVFVMSCLDVYTVPLHVGMD